MSIWELHRWECLRSDDGLFSMGNGTGLIALTQAEFGITPIPPEQKRKMEKLVQK